jgi:YesN/AraC family two-component response regulator
MNKILIVDDDKYILNGCKRLLHGSLIIDTATDAFIAFEKGAKNDICNYFD